MSDADPQSALFHCLNTPLAGRVLFINAQASADLPKDAVIVQWMKSDVDVLQAQGFRVETDIPLERFDHVLVLATKQHDETRALMARGLGFLDPNGNLIVAGANDAGGKRIEKDFAMLGLIPVSDSKHKSRVVQAKSTDILPPTALEWIDKGDWQFILDCEFFSRPGLFSWDRADKGSTLLVQTILSDLKGRGADFGCGYGYLSAHVLKHCAGVSHITALDADARAVEACRRNTSQYTDKISCVWHDLTQKPDLHNLDFIVMNPPFHEGVSTQNQLGAAFIRNAAACLKKNGVLYMVANNHLPYEDILKGLFASVKEQAQAQGFKIIKAAK